MTTEQSVITDINSEFQSVAPYDCIYRGNHPEGRKGTRCRKVATGPGSYYSAVQIEFEDGVQLLVNRNTVRTVVFRQSGLTQIVSQ